MKNIASVNHGRSGGGYSKRADTGRMGAYDVLSDDVSGTFGKLKDEGLDYEQALDVAETLDDLGDDATSVERYLAVARMPFRRMRKNLPCAE